jgi:hypothetical protein
MDSKKPSIKRIFWTDYLTAVSAIAILMFVGLFLFDRFIQPVALTQELPFIVGAACIAGIALIVWRIRRITSAFEFGWEVEGDIASVAFFRDRGSVTYIYTVQGERYKASNAVMRHRVTRGLQQGQKVIIMVNKDNPKIAFIRDIYL